MDKNRLRKVLEINGVIAETTEYILDNYFVPCDSYEDEVLRDSKLLSPFNIMGLESEIWIKVELDFANEYVENYIIPHIYADKSCYLGLNLKELDEDKFQAGISSFELHGSKILQNNYFDYPETAHPPIMDIVELDEEPFVKAMVTKDFVYYMKGDEGDDNGTVKMYMKKTGELVSDNYRACQDMFENLLYNKFEWINDDLRYSRKEMLKEQGVVLAKEYHSSNMYEGKVNNLTFDGVNGALNRALERNLGFKLDKFSLEMVHKELRKEKSRKNKL